MLVMQSILLVRVRMVSMNVLTVKNHPYVYSLNGVPTDPLVPLSEAYPFLDMSRIKV